MHNYGGEINVAAVVNWTKNYRIILVDYRANSKFDERCRNIACSFTTLQTSVSCSYRLSESMDN